MRQLYLRTTRTKHFLESQIVRNEKKDTKRTMKRGIGPLNVFCDIITMSRKKLNETKQMFKTFKKKKNPLPLCHQKNA